MGPRGAGAVVVVVMVVVVVVVVVCVCVGGVDLGKDTITSTARTAARATAE